MNQLTKARPKVLLVIFTIFTLFFTTSCGKSGGLKIPGLDGPNVDYDEENLNLMVSMTFTKMYLPIGGRYDLPKYPGSYVEIGPGVSPSGTFVAFNFNLEDLLDRKLKGEDPQSLPGGRAIPNIRSGKLPAVAFRIEKWKDVTLYMGNKIFGIFMPHKLSFDGIGPSFPYKKGDKVIGVITAIGKDSKGENSGFLLLLDMNKEVKAEMEYKVESQYEGDFGDDY